MLSEAQLERFVREFHVHPVSGCWVWDGRTSSMGFAVFDLGGGLLSYALEVALAEWCGVPIPPRSMPFDRSRRICRTRLCVAQTQTTHRKRHGGPYSAKPAALGLKS
jgi:hypothetical protein